MRLMPEHTLPAAQSQPVAPITSLSALRGLPGGLTQPAWLDTAAWAAVPTSRGLCEPPGGSAGIWSRTA